MTLRCLALLLVAGLSTGCLRMTYTVNLKPDGSGTIVQSVGMSKAALASMMETLGGRLDIKDAPDTGSMPFFTDTDLKEAAASLGDGVRVTGVAPIADGIHDGQTATFAFDDIRKVRLNLNRMFSGGLDETSNFPGDQSFGVSFARENGRSVLVLQMPMMPGMTDVSDMMGAAGAPGRMWEPPSDPDAELPPDVAKLMETMSHGYIEIAINFEGSIVFTNAPHVAGSKVTLLEMNFGQIMNTSKGVQALMGKMDGRNEAQFDELLKAAGIKVAGQKELRIEFR